MGVDTEQTIREHRTFILAGQSVKKNDRRELVLRKNPVYVPPPNNKGPSMGVVDPSHAKPGTQRAYVAHRLVAGKWVTETVREFAGQNFNAYATPWEKEWSVLCDGRKQGRLAPVVTDTGEVQGHYGEVSAANIVYFGPRDDPNTSLFVISDEIIQQMHWRKYDMTGIRVHNSVVFTHIDGQVIFSHYGHTTASLESVDFSPVDLIQGGVALVDLGAKLGKRLLAVLTRRSEQKIANRILAGPTKELVEALAKMEGKDQAKALAKLGLKVGGYEARMGIPVKHLEAMIAAAKETNIVAVFRANKKAAIDLIERGAVGKPKSLSIPGFKSSKDTGVLTASTANEFKVVADNKFFVIEADGVARRTIQVGGKPVTEELKLANAYWKKEKGQVIDPSGHPVVGDYDGLGAIALESPGRNLVPVPNNPAKGDWLGPDWERYMNAVNPKLDKMRVLHGAQDQFHDPKWGGLTDELAYAVFPDGKVVFMNGRAEQKAFYDAFGRQTAVGSYNAPGVGVRTVMQDISAKGRRK